jgi:energy-converting hydrogenase Eha subunit A
MARGRGKEARARGPNRQRYAFELSIGAPLIFLFVAAIWRYMGVIDLTHNLDYYLIALLISVLSYALSLHFRERLFINDKTPADTSMFLSNLMLFPFILMYPTSISSGMITLLAALEASMMVVAGILALLGSNIKKGEFPEPDNLTSITIAIMLVIFFGIGSLLSFALGHPALGLLAAYLSVYELFGSSVYLIQLIAYRDGIDLKKIILGNF